MNLLDAVLMLEGEQEATEEQRIAAMQLLIDTGAAWTLQGSFGRLALRMIDDGVCHHAGG